MPLEPRERSANEYLNIPRTVLLHTMQELDNDLRARPDEHLALARLFRVVDGIQRIVEDTCFDHVGEREIFSSMVGDEVSGIAKRSILACERKECPWGQGFFSSCRRRNSMRRSILAQAVSFSERQ